MNDQAFNLVDFANLVQLFNITLGECDYRDDLQTSTLFYIYSTQSTPIVPKLTRRQLINQLQLTPYFKCKTTLQCTICLETIQTNEFVRQLSCTHQFHKRCIDKWLYVNYNSSQQCKCPLCRIDIKK